MHKKIISSVALAAMLATSAPVPAEAGILDSFSRAVSSFFGGSSSGSSGRSLDNDLIQGRISVKEYERLMRAAGATHRRTGVAINYYGMDEYTGYGSSNYPTNGGDRDQHHR